MTAHSRLALVLLSSLSFGPVGCIEDGFTPDCPVKDDYLDEEGAFDFDAWRKAAEEANCVTPIGGHQGGDGGNGS